MGQVVCHTKRDKLSAIPKGTICLLYQKGQFVFYTKRDKLSAIPKGTGCLPYQKGQFVFYTKFISLKRAKFICE